MYGFIRSAGILGEIQWIINGPSSIFLSNCWFGQVPPPPWNETCWENSTAGNCELGGRGARFFWVKLICYVVSWINNIKMIEIGLLLWIRQQVSTINDPYTASRLFWIAKVFSCEKHQRITKTRTGKHNGATGK